MSGDIKMIIDGPDLEKARDLLSDAARIGKEADALQEEVAEKKALLAKLRARQKQYKVQAVSIINAAAGMKS